MFWVTLHPFRLQDQRWPSCWNTVNFTSLGRLQKKNPGVRGSFLDRFHSSQFEWTGLLLVGLRKLPENFSYWFLIKGGHVALRDVRNGNRKCWNFSPAHRWSQKSQINLHLLAKLPKFLEKLKYVSKFLFWGVQRSNFEF